MKEIRILFTGTGRRVELLQAFHNAALCLNINLKIYGADIAGTAPALAYCNYIRKICAMKDKDYIPELLEICGRDKIDLVIPTIDTDLLVLSQNADRFKKIGTRVLISSPDMIALCRDKNYTSDFFEACGLKAPRPVNDYRKYDGEYPCFIKPKDGSSSIDAYKINAESELAMYAGKIGDYIIQPFIEGKEYTIDIFCDFDGNPIYIIPRERVAVRSGEVLKAEISLDEKIIEETKRLVSHFKPCGPMTVQLIRQNETGDDYFIEINPRYGGGAPLSIKAGADSASALLRLLCGETLTYQEDAARNGAVYSRFDQSICVASESRIKGDGMLALKGIIFDLDDTLYSEKQYVKSGYAEVAKFLGNRVFAEKLWNYFLEGKSAIDELLNELGQPEKKQDCLSIYRNQMPNIELYDGAYGLLTTLKSKGFKIGIITDGRVNGQKNKIEALGLTDLVDDIIITDELGGEQFRKPNDIAFRIIQCRWRLPFAELAYIGDNMIKDFQAPKQLGMKSIYFQNEDGLYYDADCDADEYDLKITALRELSYHLK
ncbi:MAG: HAD hydrolase-like protein [Lachnospiraceae bacterium]|nr:HAD hydrolase-like protein [Lachnospiraceae bacterium]